jgi:hypothetical protein
MLRAELSMSARPLELNCDRERSLWNSAQSFVVKELLPTAVRTLNMRFVLLRLTKEFENEVGDCCFNFCALATGFNLEAAAELFNSFFYACDTNANRPGSRRVIQHSLGYSATFITDRYDHSIQILLNPYLSSAGSRMKVRFAGISAMPARM